MQIDSNNKGKNNSDNSIMLGGLQVDPMMVARILLLRASTRLRDCDGSLVAKICWFLNETDGYEYREGK